MIDLKELRRLAEAATPGPWYVECGVSQRTGWAIRSNDRDILFLDGSRNCDLDEKTNDVEENQDFITSFNPDTVLKLLEIAEWAERAKGVLEFYRDQDIWRGLPAETAIETLAAYPKGTDE